MPNPRVIIESNARRIVELIEINPDIAGMFDRRMASDVCAIFAAPHKPNIIGEMQESPSIILETRTYGEPMFKVVKVSPPSFLRKDQKDFFMSKFPLKGKNE